MKRFLKRLLPWACAASAVTGVGLHGAGHGASHGVWHDWAAVHILSSLLWLVCVVSHIRMHSGWYRAVAAKGLGKRSRTTLILSVLFAAATATGVVLAACVEGPGSGIGLWHYRLGLLLAIFALIHYIKRRR